MSVSKTSDHIKIGLKMPIQSEEPPASSKAPRQDLKDMDVLCTFKIKIEPKLGIWVFQQPVTSDHILIKIEMPKPSQEPPEVQLKGQGCYCITKSTSRCQTPIWDKLNTDWKLSFSESIWEKTKYLFKAEILWSNL